MSNFPAKALILAAGYGNRLRPLTNALPKPLIPLWNKPLLDHMIDLLIRHGVKEIVVNTHWQPELIKSHLAGVDFGIPIHVSFEPEILGTGGALQPWREFFSDEPFWVVNGDIAAALDLSELLKAFDSLPNQLGTCWVTSVKGPRTVEMDRAGRLTCYRSPDPGIDGTYTFCGIQLLSPRIFSFMPESGFSTLVDLYQRAMSANLFMRGVELSDSYWNDAGTLERYREIHQETKDLARVSLTGGELYDSHYDLLRDQRNAFFCVCADTHCAAGAKGTDSIVLAGSLLGANAVLKSTVVCGGQIDGSINEACCVDVEMLDEPRLQSSAAGIEWDLKSCAFDLIGRRGSNRTFWRGFNRDQRAIFIIDEGGRAENKRYAGHTSLLQSAGVPVPALLYVSDDNTLLVLEDMGDTSLTQKVSTAPQRIEKLYSDVLKAVASFHKMVAVQVAQSQTQLEPGFDRALDSWEHELFETYLLRERLGYDAIPDAVRQELDSIAAALEGGSQTVIHRDLQSSNILYKGRRFAFIDYQGMRLGSPVYDIASLLYDPYVNMTTKCRCKLAADYAALVPEYPDVVELFFKGAVQRLVQSLGAYGRLIDAGQIDFAKYILPGLENLLEAADAAELDGIGALAEELIAREQMRKCGY